MFPSIEHWCLCVNVIVEFEYICAVGIESYMCAFILIENEKIWKNLCRADTHFSCFNRNFNKRFQVFKLIIKYKFCSTTA